jgi:hypothetical protein
MKVMLLFSVHAVGSNAKIYLASDVVLAIAVGLSYLFLNDYPAEQVCIRLIIREKTIASSSPLERLPERTKNPVFDYGVR